MPPHRDAFTRQNRGRERWHVAVQATLLLLLCVPGRKADAQLAPLTQDVFTDNFDAGAMPNWTPAPAKTQNYPFEPGLFLGRFFDSKVVTLDIQGIPPHTTILIKLRLLIVGDWWGNAVPPAGPSVWTFEVENGPRMDFSFSNIAGANQSFPEPYPVGDYPARQDSLRQNAFGFLQKGPYPILPDAEYDMRLAWSHIGGSVRVKFYATGLLAAAFWGMDDFVFAVPTAVVVGFVPSRVPIAGDQHVTIYGRHLDRLAGYIPAINGVPVTDFRIQSPRQATFLSPPHPEGLGDLHIATAADTIPLRLGAIRFVPSVLRNIPIVGGTEPHHYRMFGIPAAFPNPVPIINQLANQIDFRDPTLARVFRFDPASNQYLEGFGMNLSPARDMIAGMGFWGISRFSGTAQVHGGQLDQGMILPTGTFVPEPGIAAILGHGWNQVSPGVGRRIALEHIYVTDGRNGYHLGDADNNLTSQFLFRYRGSPDPPYYERAVGAINGLEAFWIRNVANPIQDILIFFGDPALAHEHANGADKGTGTGTTGGGGGPSGEGLSYYALTSDAAGMPPPPPVTLLAAAEGTEGSSGGGCFLATAAYGSSQDTRLRPLRTFRDTQLHPSQMGRDFTQTYYAASPPLAQWVRSRPLLRSVARQAIDVLSHAVRP